MKLPITSLCEEIFIFIVYGLVNISRHGSLPGATYGVLTYLSMSKSHLLNIIAGGGIRLHFLLGTKANNATAPHIQKMMHCGIYFDRENASWDS